MIYEFVTAYQVRGVKFNENEIILLDSHEIDARLCKSLVDVCQTADLELALRNNFLNRMFCGSSDTVEDEFKKIRDSREKDAYYIVVRCRGPFSFDEANLRSEVLFRVGMDAFEKSALRESRLYEVNRVVATALCSFHLDPWIKRIVFAFYGIDDQKKPVFSLKLKVSAEATVQRQFDKTGLELFKRVYQSNSANVFQKPTGLLLSACNSEVDDFRSFQSAWTSLERLTLEYFKAAQCAKGYFDDLKVGASPGKKKVIDNIDGFMDTRFSLVDKFIIIANKRFPDTAEEDWKLFDELKKIRDKITHGELVDDLKAPAQRAKTLLRSFWLALNE